MLFLPPIFLLTSARGRRILFIVLLTVLLTSGWWLMSHVPVQGSGTRVYLPLVGRSSVLPMMVGEEGYEVEPLLTVGETVPGSNGALNPYTPVGIMDGVGAVALDADTVRVFVNHELKNDDGYAYEVDDGAGGVVILTGARISTFDIDKDTRELVAAGLAYHTIYDREYNRVTTPNQLDTPDGLDLLCSSGLFVAEQFGVDMGLADTVYFAGEENRVPTHPHGGTEYALDIVSGELWAAPEMGRAAWENVTELDTGTTTHVAFLIGDDTPEASLYLYIGEKNGVGDSSFLDRNGLKQGQLYFWKSDTGELDPSQFNTSGILNGSWEPIDVRDVSMADMPGYDDLGYKDSDTLQNEADANGGFSFSRPEDVATNPANGAEAVLASTGREGVFGNSDVVGTLYVVEVDFGNLGSPTADITIIYDGDADPAQELRSPDNLDWADDGWIYVQEDRAAGGLFGAGAANPNEASMVRIDPAAGTIERVAEINRAAVPPGQIDTDPEDVGDWESSGVLDVSDLFGEAPGTLFVFDVQAHSVGGGVINGDEQLVEGGQLLWLTRVNPTYASLSGPDGDPAGAANWYFPAVVLGVAALWVTKGRSQA